MRSTGGTSQEPNDTDAQIEALKWIAAKGTDPIERVLAFRKVFELRNQQLEQARVQ